MGSWNFEVIGRGFNLFDPSQINQLCTVTVNGRLARFKGVKILAMNAENGRERLNNGVRMCACDLVFEEETSKLRETGTELQRSPGAVSFRTTSALELEFRRLINARRSRDYKRKCISLFYY